MAEDAKKAWVAAVLGVTWTTSPLRQPKPLNPKELMEIWNEAKEAVDVQIGKLQRAFRGVDHPLGAAIADRGLTAFTGKLLTGLQVALFNLASASTNPKVMTALLKAIDALLGFLDTHPALPVLERNPFGVTVTIRSLLGTALHTMRDTVEAALSVENKP